MRHVRHQQEQAASAPSEDYTRNDGAYATGIHRQHGADHSACERGLLLRLQTHRRLHADEGNLLAQGQVRIRSSPSRLQHARVCSARPPHRDYSGRRRRGKCRKRVHHSLHTPASPSNAPRRTPLSKMPYPNETDTLWRQSRVAS
ncbi:unnamed protein product [Ectocarpus sp. 12 AP-2014]